LFAGRLGVDNIQVGWSFVFALSSLAACSFQHGRLGTNPGDGGELDGAVADTALTDGTGSDGPLPIICSVGAASATGTDRGRVGGSGGSENFPPLVCTNAADRIVGLELRMSDQATLYGDRSAHAIRIACAPVTITDGIGTTGTVYTREIIGNGNYDWSPSTLTGITQCQPGWVMSGLSAHTTSDGDLFLDVSITCSQISSTGSILATETIYVAGSLDEQNGNDAVSCNSGEILTRMSSRNGAGIDSVNLWCTPPTCL
jgi:hypothetical protein